MVKTVFSASSRLVHEFRPYRVSIGMILVLGLIVSAVQPLSVRIAERVINELKAGISSEFFRSVPLALILLFGVSGLAKYFHNTLRRKVTEKVVLALRAKLFHKYLALPLRELDTKRSGELLSQIQNELQLIAQGIDTVCDCLKEPFTILGLVAVAFYCDWKLSIVTLAAAPLVALLFSRTGYFVKRYAHRNLAQFSDLMGLTQESIVGTRIIKVFRLETLLGQKFSAIQDSFLKTVCKSINIQEIATPLVEFIGAVLMAGVIIYGSYRVSSGYLTTGALVAFIIAIGLIQMPIKKLNNAYMKLKAAEAASEKVYLVLDIAIPEQTRGLRRIEELRDSIRYDKVTLKYSDKMALRDISFEVRRGECLALVGKSGSGKSSVVNLLARLYEVSSGRLLFDGVDMREIDLGDLRRMISFVTQDVFLFADTILENIRYGRPEASPKEIEKAAKSALCMEFIEKLAGGFHAKIGERGMTLSGGERQRLAIARAILKGAPILVLDEATSNLDSHSETQVQQALDELMVGKTTFLIAHRFSTLRNATKILTLSDGEIIEFGTPVELVRKEGLYYSLLQNQKISEPVIWES